MADNARLKVYRVAIGDLHEDPDNVRTHDKRNIEAIKTSLTKFGQVEPLVVQDKSGLIIGGHGRLQSMKELGWIEVDVVRLDIDDAKAKALGLALNRTAELANWDYRGLQTILEGLNAEADGIMDGLGWTPEEIETLCAATWDPPTPEGDLGETGSSGPNDLSRRRFGIVGLDVSLTAEQRALFDKALGKAKEENEFETDGDFVIHLCQVAGLTE